MDDTQFPSTTDRARLSGQLWQMMWHEDNLLATRVSVFLVAESILVAVAATLINTVAKLTHGSASLRPEMFGLTGSISLAGLILTLVFWYVLTLNYENVGALMNDLKVDDIGLEVLRMRAQRRNDRWYFRIIFRKKGMNWVIAHVLPLIFLFLWCIMIIFLLFIFLF